MVHVLLQQGWGFSCMERRLDPQIKKVYLNIIVTIIKVNYIPTLDHTPDVNLHATFSYIKTPS
jgi:hypothetical protein